MIKLTVIASALLLSSGGSLQQKAPAEPAVPDAAAIMSLNGTTWEFNDRGVPTVITIEADGRYIENRLSGEHVVHGTYRQVNGKDCFISAVGDRSTSCWTAVPPTKVGETASAKSDAGHSASFKRVAYRKLSIGN